MEGQALQRVGGSWRAQQAVCQAHCPLLAPSAAATAHPRCTGVCILWAVLAFRKSDGQVLRPLCPSQNQMGMFRNESRAGCPA